jgi:hypothetical protein
VELGILPRGKGLRTPQNQRFDPSRAKARAARRRPPRRARRPPLQYRLLRAVVLTYDKHFGLIPGVRATQQLET